MRESTAWNRAVLALILALLAVNVYRAATQSITIDEAFTFNHFVAAPAADAVRFYDANNHPLNTLLIALSTAAFGASELTVRLPSLAGGALFLFAAWRLGGCAFGGSWLTFLAVATAGLNPFVLDYLSAARGYGMALGWMLLALERMVRYLAAGGEGRVRVAGISLGLAVASNLVFAVPSAALAAAFACLVLRGARPRAAAWNLIDGLAVPAVVTAFIFLVVPLSHASGGHFYYGAGSLWEFASSLSAASFGAGPAPGWFAAGAGLLAVASGVGFARALRRPGPLDARAALAALTGGAVVLSLAALIGMHHAAGMPYPLDRTGIYWLPLLVLAAFSLARRRAARAAVAVVALCCLLQFALLFRVDRYGAWTSDAGARRMVEALRAREKGARPVRVTGSWQLEPALNFYRRTLGLNWLAPVERGAVNAPGDYRAFTAEDAAAVDRLGLRVVYRDPVSGAVLAE